MPIRWLLMVHDRIVMRERNRFADTIQAVNFGYLGSRDKASGSKMKEVIEELRKE